MLSGEYKHTVDAKNRLFIPVKHRDRLGDTFMVVKSYSEPCLTVYSMAEWEKVDEKLQSLPMTSTKGLTRFLYSSAMEAQPDAQGRILLTPELKAYAKIDRNAVVVGCGRYAEIWSDELYETKIAEQDPEEYTEILKSFGF